MDRETLNYLNEHQLSSVMNKTKWRKLAKALTANEEFEPKVWLKYLRDKAPTGGYCHLDWEWVKHGESSCIEWLVIDPVKSEFLGHLVKPRESDYSEFIEAALLASNVPYSIEGTHYKVWGYVRPGESSEFV